MSTQYPHSHNPHMKPGENTADYCRRMKYQPGTHLTGDEGYGPLTLVITAVGEQTILAYNLETPNLESSWDLHTRPWKETTP